MPPLSAASRLAFPYRPAHFVRPSFFTCACADPPPSRANPMDAAESRDSLSLPTPEVKAETTTVNVGTLRVTKPKNEAAEPVVAEIQSEVADEQKPPEPPACSAEC